MIVLTIGANQGPANEKTYYCRNQAWTMHTVNNWLIEYAQEHGVQLYPQDYTKTEQYVNIIGDNKFDPILRNEET